MSYLVLKAFHLIFVVCWFAGLFYLGRLFIYFKEKSEPLKEAIVSSLLLSIDKKTGNIMNKNIIKQPAKMLIDVFNFIVVK